VVEILVEAGADVSAKGSEGKLSLRVLYFPFTLIVMFLMIMTVVMSYCFMASMTIIFLMIIVCNIDGY